MKLKQIVLLSTALIFSQQATAVGKNKTDRWFEMEVILFSQLGDKTQLKEQFSEKSALPKYRNVIDLLGPYLNPDIRSLKQQLPSCETAVYPDSLLNQAILAVRSTPFYQPKSLLELEDALDETIDDSLTGSSESLFSDGTHTENSNETLSQTTNNSSEKGLSQNNDSQQADSEDSFYSNNSLSIEQNINNGTPIAKELSEVDSVIDSDKITELTAEQQQQRLRLLVLAEDEFSDIQFDYANETASFTQQICTISVKQFNQYNHENLYDNYYAFNIVNMPSTINNNEDIYGDNDYLLNKESLQLHDIVKQLARSRNFKPLLHIGWRQKTKTKRLAVPMKIYAGENFANHHQQELQEYQQQLKQAQSQENSLQKALFDNDTETNTDVINTLTEEELTQQVIAERIQELIVEIPVLPSATEDLINELDNNIATTHKRLSSKNMLTAPMSPPQDWTLEGFLKFEVDHFLRITADFNIMNMSLAQLATQELLPEGAENQRTLLRTVNFKQNRRVISKEIHYFDHPYIGMIIRILPYEKPIEEAEEASSAE